MVIQTEQRTHPLTETEQNANARSYIHALLVGEKPLALPDVGPLWRQVCLILLDSFERAESVDNALKSIIKSDAYKGLGALMAEDSLTPSSQNGHNGANGHHITPEQQDRNARAYIQALQKHEKPVMPDVGQKWIQCCVTLQGAHDANPDNFEDVLKSFIKNDLFKGIKALMADKVEISLQGNVPGIPELDKKARTPQNFDPNSSEAYRFLRTYVEFSKKASPEGYEDFHLFCALWMLSVTVARRVYVWLGREKIYTNLKIALCAESTAYAKSVTAKAAISCIEDAELYHLIIRGGKITPEKLMANMAGKCNIPTNYNELDPSEQKPINRRIAMAGQKGIYWDEFGKFIKSMIKENSPMAKYQDLLLELDDCVTNGNDTVTRGDETIEKPYLPILGALIPSTMKSAARAGSELWQDGNFARCGFVCAPASGGIDAPLSTGRLQAPPEIIHTLLRMNDWLGEAEVEITIDEKSGKPSIEILRGLPECECTLSSDANKAQQAYRSALKQLCNSNKDVPADLKAGYIRLAATALRIAMLLASLEASKDQTQTKISVTLTHWRVAQEMAEILRRNLHTFYAQVNNHKTYAASREDEIMAVAQKSFSQKWFTANDIKRFLNDRYSTKEINDILQSLKNSTLDWMQSTHTATGRYKLKDENE